MNKILVGIVVIVVGGLVGWYALKGGAKLPGMKIGTDITVPAPSGTNLDVTITDESPVVGESKGGVLSNGAVSYTDKGYSPATITVKKGTNVVFTNTSSLGMWTASAQHPTHQVLPGFDQKKSVSTGGTYEYTFLKVGTWKYHNHVKATDTGIVIVTE